MEARSPKVVILCGGRGVRFHEATENTPKPLVEIGAKPILWHIMKIYSHYGYQDFVLCLGYKGDLIRRYFLDYDLMNCDFTIRLGNKRKIEQHNVCLEGDWRVTLAETGLNAMTGARVKRIEKIIDSDTFMLTYGDAVANVDINRLMDFHRSHGKIGTITGVRPLSRFGELQLGENNLVQEFLEKPVSRGDHINGGFFVFNRKIFDYIDDSESVSLERAPLERLAKDGQLMAFIHNDYWQCMDTYRDWQILNDACERNNMPWKVW
jgi:glucose-1-phosphate cytidylyltransferase